MTCALGCREPHGDSDTTGTLGVGPVLALPSTCLQKVDEQPEDADNQRNVTRMGGQPSDVSTTVDVPVAPTGQPGEPSAVPSEYLPVPAGSPSSPSFLLLGGLCGLSPQPEKVFCPRLCPDVPV